MPIVDRMEFPRRYKLHQTILLLVVLAAAFGIWYNGYTQKAKASRINIHSIRFVDYGATYIRLGYDIENTGRRAEDLSLLARVYDAQGEEIASFLFAESLAANTREFRIKTLEKLARPLKEGEKPHRATLELLTRKVL